MANEKITFFSEHRLNPDWGEDDNAMVRLWRSVLDQLITDMTYTGVSVAALRDRKMAYLWFTGKLQGISMEKDDRASPDPSHDCGQRPCFDEVCDLAQLDPTYCRRSVERLIPEHISALRNEYGS